MAEEINKNQLLEQKKAVFDMIVEGPKLSGEAEAKEDDPYSLDTERGEGKDRLSGTLRFYGNFR